MGGASSGEPFKGFALYAPGPGKELGYVIQDTLAARPPGAGGRRCGKRTVCKEVIKEGKPGKEASPVRGHFRFRDFETEPFWVMASCVPVQELQKRKFHLNRSLEAPVWRRYVQWAYFISKVVKEGLGPREWLRGAYSVWISSPVL